MTTAVDTNVLLDVWTRSPFAPICATALHRAMSEGSLVICEVVLAELGPAFASRGELAQFLGAWALLRNESADARAGWRRDAGGRGWRAAVGAGGFCRTSSLPLTP